jgi:outer membrane protein OmpA-like peptidoglycan-associated protein
VPDESLERIARAMRALADENRSLRADVDSLRRSLATQDASTSAAAAPVRTPAAPRVEETRTSRRMALGEALRRIPLVHENPEVIRETPSGYRLALTGDMAFASSRSELSVAAREALRQVALVMFRFQDSVGRIDGHADSWGTPEGNMRMSVERAMAVRDELIRLGIDPERLIARGRGSESPVADNTTAEGRARNRRVEIYLDERQ